MAHQLVLGTILGGAVQPMPYTLNTQYEPASLAVSAEEREQTRRRLMTTNTVFGVGLISTGIGVAAVGVGAVVAIVGLFGYLLTGSDTMMMVGGVTVLVGVGVVMVAIPVTVVGALAGNAVVRQAGIEVSSTPGLIALSGIGVTLAGAMIENDLGGSVSSAGFAMIVIGSGVQVLMSNRAFKEYEQEASQASLHLHPVRTLDGYGAGMTLRF